MSDHQLLRNLVLNLWIGASAGAIFCTTLLFADAHDIWCVLQHSSSPVAATVILIAASSVYFSFGAVLTGSHFAIMDECNPNRR